MNSKDNVSRKTTDRSLTNWVKNASRFYYMKSMANIKRRQSNIWIFSCWEGMKYADNSKYLYEYVENNLKAITPIWMTSNKDVYERLLSEGHRVELNDTANAMTLQKKADVAFFTHGLDDFGKNPHIYGSFIVNLWHGVPLNKLGYYNRPVHSNPVLIALWRLKGHIFSYINNDLTIATSDKAARSFRDFTLHRKDIKIIGQPRTDLLVSNDDIKKQVFDAILSHYFDQPEKYHYILFMPTYRSTPKSQKFLEHLLSKIVENTALNEYLNANNTKILMKMHYLTDISEMVFSDNIICIDDRDVADSEELLLIADALITDYSSVCFDFALKEKEILLFAPDKDTYISESGLLPDFSRLINKYAVTEVNQLVEKVIATCDNNFEPSSLCTEINCLCNSKKNEIGNFCKIVCDTVISRV